ncbi:P2Y purinoceptor 2-like [Microcaecilia unicolor]|uniref:P2Y purinoceptor 2 n=1 Tax=Microcaecilia unicolor TaxID=1415580 RepID=A0A6P7XYS3_9AMPH|nr:P2Y purinoceptor 2-like [Microcaecilia unicolor]
MANFPTTTPWAGLIPNITNSSDGGRLYKCMFNEDFKYILLPVSYGIVFCVGLTLNVLSLYLFIFKIKPWKASTTYMFNLALSDTLYVVSLPLLIHYYSKENHWPFGVALCKMVRFLFYTNLYCSIFFLLSISIHRFLGVYYPIQLLRWGHVRCARIVSVIVWITVIGFQSPLLYFTRTSMNGDCIICHDTTSPELFVQFVDYSSVCLALLFCVPFTVIIICYSLMARTLMRPSSATSTPSKSKQKSIKMIIIVVVVFIICFLPFHVNRTLYYYFRKHDFNCDTLNAMNIAYKVTRPLASANCCLDPILYFLVGQAFRRRLPARKKDKHIRNCFAPPVKMGAGQENKRQSVITIM